MALMVGLPGHPSSHAAPRVTAGLRVAFLDIDGNFGIVPSIDLIGLTSSASALGLKEETVFQPHVDFNWKDWHLWLIGFQAEYSGSGTADTTIQIGNFPPITKGTPVRTDVGFKYLTANFVYDIIPTDSVDIGVGLGGGLVNYELAFQSEVSSLSASLDNTLPFVFPMVRVAKEIGSFGFTGTFGGIAVEFGAHDITYLQLDLGINYRFFDQDKKPRGYLTLGYQFFNMDYVYEDQGSIGIIDVILSGPYLGLALSF